MGRHDDLHHALTAGTAGAVVVVLAIGCTLMMALMMGGPGDGGRGGK